MGEIKILPVSEWTPDLPPLSDGAANVLNVLPRTSQSYGPFPSLSSYATSALAARCQGAYSGLDPAGAVHLFAGTSSDLFRMTSSGPTFANVSKSAAAYACPADSMWRFAIFKNRVVATNIVDPIQSFVIGTDTAFADLGGSPPKARYIASVKNWLVVANTYDGAYAPWRVHWSAVNNPASWPTAGTSAAAAAQSDYNDTVGEGGWIQGLVGNLGSADMGVFYEHAVWRGVYVGPPAIFDFTQAAGVKGTPAPGSIVQLGGQVCYIGEDGFYSFDGGQATPIGFDKVDKTFFADVDQAYMFRIVGAVDPINKLILWAYPGAGHTQGNPNKILAYHWVTGHWSRAELDVEYIFRALSFGYTLDGLDATGYNMDTLPFSLDSRAWTGGAMLLAGFSTSHVLGFFSGSALAPTVDTREIQPIVGRRTRVVNTRPLVDGGSPSVTLGSREMQTSAKTFGSAAAMNSLGACPLRGSGRYVTGRITLPAASSFTHISGLELDYCDGGSR